jgi:hypothetical protein
MQDLYGDKAVFVYIDTSKYPPGSAMGKWVAAGHNISTYTRVYSVQADENGRPAKLKDLGGSWGTGWDVVGRTQDRVNAGQREMLRERPRFTDFSEVGHLPLAELKATRDKIAVHMAVADAAARPKGTDANPNPVPDPIKATEHFMLAVREADKFSPQQLHDEQRLLARELEAARLRKDPKKQAEVVDQQKLVQELQEAQWKTRLEFGLACGHLGRPEDGKKYILEAGQRNPKLWEPLVPVLPLTPSPAWDSVLPRLPGAFTPMVAVPLAANKYSPADIQDLITKSQLPEYKPFVLRDPPLRRDLPRPTIRPDERTAPLTEAIIESRYEFSDNNADPRRNLEAAKKKSFETGRPLVVVLGGKTCPECKKYEMRTMEQVRQLDQQGAVFVYVSAERRPDIYEQSGAAGFPATIVYNVNRGPLNTFTLRQRALQQGNQDLLTTQTFLAPFLKKVELKPTIPKLKGWPFRLAHNDSGQPKTVAAGRRQDAAEGTLDLSANPYELV